MKISLILPSRQRPERLAHALETFRETTQDFDTEQIVIADHDLQTAEVAAMRGATVLYYPDQRGAIQGWNDGLRLAKGDAFVLGADDLTFYPSWLDKALEALASLPNGQGMVGFNDLSEWQNEHHLATHWLITRECVKTVMGGVMAIPVYRHYYFDPEMNERAKAAGCWTLCDQSWVEHCNHLSGKAKWDVVYDESEKNFEHDQTVYEWRKAHGFPMDWQPVI